MFCYSLIRDLSFRFTLVALTPRCASRGQFHLFLRNQQDLSAEEEQSRASLAAAQLDAWIAHVKQQGPAELRKALSAFRDWRSEMLAFFDFLPTRLSNGFVEGKNNRTKAIMRQAYGYRNRRHLRLRILLQEIA